MLQRLFFVSFLTLAVFYVGGSFASAQTVGIAGKVELLQADGTRVPVEGATVDLFRTDIKQDKPTSDKTDKKGKFSFIGLQPGFKYALAASAPNAAPNLISNAPLGAEDIVITLSPGDGKRLTAEDVRQKPAAGGFDLGGTTTAKPDSQQKAMSEEEAKKAQAEYEKKVAEVTAKNKKLEDSQKIYQAASKEAETAFNEKNYDVAIAKYDEAYQADPDYWGTAPIFLRNKAIALRMRGAGKFNSAAKMPDKTARNAGYAEAGKDFQAAVEANQKALDVLAKSTMPTDAVQAKSFEANRFAVLKERVEAFNLLLKADPSKGADGVPIFQEYIAVETDGAKKNKAQLSLAQALFATDFEKAVPEYQKVLAVEPNNPDALYDMGSLYISLGGVENDKAKIQEGIGYMEKFLKAAPSGFDQAKIDDAKAQIEVNTAMLKGTDKPATPGKRKN